MKKTTALLLALSIPVGAMAGGFMIPEQGAKPSGMAGAFTGLANDPSAIYFNPAGISQLKGMQLLVGSTFVSPASQYQNPAVSNTIYEQNDLFFVVPQLFFTYEWEDNLTFGAGIYAPYGLGTEWQNQWPGDNLSREIHLQNIHFSGVVSYQVMENMSVAATFAWSYANATLERKAEGAGLAQDVTLDGTGSGVHWGVSALFKPMDNLSFGLSYRGATDLELTGDIVISDKKTPAAAANEGAGKVVLPLPQSLSLGVAYSPLDNLVLTADYNFNGWSAYEKLEIENTDQDRVLSSSPRNWKNTSTYRFGAQYTLFGDLDLRGGFLYDQDPVETMYSEPSLPDAARTGYTIGAGYRLYDNVQIDAYSLFLFWEEKEVTDNEFNFNGIYNTYATLFGVTASITF